MNRNNFLKSILEGRFVSEIKDWIPTLGQCNDEVGNSPRNVLP